MLFSLLATFLVGAAVWILIWAGYRTLGRKAPGFLIPMSVGLSMLLYTVWSEYSWFARTSAALPAEFSIVQSYGESRPWAPWTYLVPRVNRFIAVDGAKTRTHPQAPHMAMVETVMVKRNDTPVKVQQMVDCSGHRFTDLAADTVFGAGGLPVNVRWTSGEAFPNLMAALCRDGKLR